MEVENFLQLLIDLVSADNAKRHAADSQYSQLLQSQPNLILEKLIEGVLLDQAPAYLRQLCVVLLRRLIVATEDSYMHRLNDANKATILAGIYQVLLTTTDHSLRMKMAEIAGELGGGIIDPKEWPAVFELTNQLCTVQSTAEDREIGLTLLGLIADSQIAIHGTIFLKQAAIILQNSFQLFAGNARGTIATMKACDYTLQSIRTPSQVEDLKSVVASLFQAFSILIQELLSNRLSERLFSIFMEHLIDIADHSISFYENHIDMMLPPLLDFIDGHIINSALPTAKACATQMLEFIVTLCVQSSKRVKKVHIGNKKTWFINRFFPLCLQLMASIHDHHMLWLQAETVEDNSDNTQAEIGESAFRRVSAALGVSHCVKTVSKLITAALQQQQDWKQIYAALIMLSCFVESSSNINDEIQLQLHRQEVVNTLQHFLQATASPVSPVQQRLVYSALYIASPFFMHHGSGLSLQQVDQLLKLLSYHVLREHQSSPRVRRAAIIAIIQAIEAMQATSPFQESLDEQQELLHRAGYLQSNGPALLALLCQAMQEGPMIVQESSLAGIASLADIARHSKGLFQWNDIYPQLMPLLQSLLMNTHGRPTLESLFTQTLDCLTLVGEAAGSELFQPIAQQLMIQLAMWQQQEGIEPHSDLDLAFLKAWVRIARCLGPHEQQQHLPMLIERIFSVLAVDIKVPQLELDEYRQKYGGNDDDNDDEDMDNDHNSQNEDEGMEMVEAQDGSGWVAVRTSLVEQQLQALQMALLLAEKLQAAFYPYTGQMMKLLESLLSSHHEDIRSAAVALLPELVHSTLCFCTSNYNNNSSSDSFGPLLEVAAYMLGKLLQYLEKETALELIMTALQAMKTVILLAATNPSSTTADNQNKYRPVFESAQILAICEGLKLVLRDSLQRRAVMRAEREMEKQEGLVNENDDDEDNDNDQLAAVQQEMFELHFNLADVLGSLAQTHKQRFPQRYLEAGWHELLMNLSHGYCLVEDQRLSFLTMCDIAEYTFLPNNNDNSNQALTPGEFASPEAQQEIAIQMLQRFEQGCGGDVASNEQLVYSDLEVIRAAAYGLGMMYAKCHAGLQHLFTANEMNSLVALQRVIVGQSKATELGTKKAAGMAVDNAVAAVGRVVVRHYQFTENSNGAPDQWQYLLLQWLQFLPLQHDSEEGDKVVNELCDLFTTNGSMQQVLLGQSAPLTAAVKALINCVHSDRVSAGPQHRSAELLYSLFEQASSPLKLSAEHIANVSAGLDQQEQLTLAALLQTVGILLKQ